MMLSNRQSFRNFVKINLARVQENEGTTELKVITSFTDDKIQIHHVNTGNTSNLSYDVINRFVETKNMYTLFTKAHQFVVVNKASIIQDHENEDFIRFIKDKCKNIQW